MKMKYILLLLLILPVVSAKAQRMVIENGAIYIESFGVRSDLVSPGPALKQEILSDGKVRTRYHQGVSSGVNLLIPRKFQVAKADSRPAANRNFYQHSGLADGKDGRPGTPMAVGHGNNNEGCDDYSEQADGSDKGKWRVPTINEYILMASFLSSYNLSISGVSGFTPPSIQFGSKYGFWYISSTTRDDNINEVYSFMWYPDAHTNLINRLNKNAGGRVRCILDVE